MSGTFSCTRFAPTGDALEVKGLRPGVDCVHARTADNSVAHEYRIVVGVRPAVVPACEAPELTFWE